MNKGTMRFFQGVLYPATADIRQILASFRERFGADPDVVIWTDGGIALGVVNLRNEKTGGSKGGRK